LDEHDLEENKTHIFLNSINKFTISFTIKMTTKVELKKIADKNIGD